MKKTMKVKRLTRLALIFAVLVIMAFTPLGFIMVPPVSITLMHIPVIVGSIVLGPLCGGFLGLSFGIISMIKATVSAGVGDILFSPVLSGMPLESIIMCIVPRVILGILPGLLYIAFSKTRMAGPLKSGIAAAISTIVHTFSVLFCMMVFFKGMLLADIFMYIVGVNGLLEILAATIVASAVCGPLLKNYMKD